MPPDLSYLWSIKEHRKIVPWRGCRGMNVHVFGNSGEALTIVFVGIFTLHESHYHGWQVRKWFSLLSLRESDNSSKSFTKTDEKIAWWYPETQKDKYYIHRGGVGNEQFGCFRELLKRSVVWSGSDWRAALTRMEKRRHCHGCPVRP